MVESAEDTYFTRAMQALDNPESLWRTAFDSHLNSEQQLAVLLISVLPSATEFEDYRKAWQAMLDYVPAARSLASFERTASVLEGSFVHIRATGECRYVSAYNPSVLDFVVGHLGRNPELAQRLVLSPVFFQQLQRLVEIGFRGSNSYWSGIAAERASSQPQAGVERVLISMREDFAEAAVRLFESRNTQRTGYSGEGRERFNYTPPIDLTERLDFLMQLPDPIRPDERWMADRIQVTVAGWQPDCRDNRRTGLEVFARAHEDTTYDDSLRKEMRTRIVPWLDDNPEETSDWDVLIELAELLDLYDDLALGERIYTFIDDELGAWSPAPPDLSRLKDLTNDIGAWSDFGDRIEEAERSQAAADDHANDQENWRSEGGSGSSDRRTEDSQITSIFEGNGLRERN